MDYSGYESEAKTKRKQHCTYCKNHGKKSRKTNHKCDHENCECLLCKLTRLSRLIMRHQQRLWRHLKDSKKREEAGDAAGAKAAATDMNSAVNSGAGSSTKQQKCDMCRNHGEIKSKRAHKNSCLYQNCTCALCNLTRKRRDIMRHQQRVRRSQVTSKQENEAWQYITQATAELNFLNYKTSVTSDDNHPSSPSPSTSASPSPVSSSTSSSMSLKSEVMSASVTPATPIATTTKNLASVTPEMPPLEPLHHECSPVRYSPVLTGPPISNPTRHTDSLTPPEQVSPSKSMKDIPVLDNEPAWRNLKREREEVFNWSPKVHTRENDLFGHLDFMRSHHQTIAGRLEPPVPMEGIHFHDSISTMDFAPNHAASPYKSLMPMMNATRLPPTPLKKTRTDENLHLQYNPMFWGNIPIDPRVGFIPEDFQQQCYRRVIMNTSDLRMRTPPGLIPISQPQPPLRPRPMAPIRPHALSTTGMEWDHVNKYYLACILQNQGGPHIDTMPLTGPFGLTREASFLHPPVP